MSELKTSAPVIGRRGFVVRTIAAIQAVMGATIAYVFGGAILAPSFGRREESWLKAASIDALRDNEPVAVTLRIARQDGYAQIVDRTVVYLVKTGEQEVRALQSTCTHLGCRTSYDRRTKRILCPCHGGVFDAEGRVLEGPPPAPLPTLATRVEDGEVLVQI
jgi:menaquinol-cytochrome c reductase iron-sulfur subunit